MVSSAAMEDKSLQIRPRKRKQYSSSKSSDLFTGTFTRSKSQIHLHKNRSGRAWMDTPARKNFHRPHLLLNSPLKKPRRLQCSNLENGASLDHLSIKDLRARARRVFSPTGNVVEEEMDDCSAGFDFEEEKCNGSVKMLDKCENFEVGLEGLDLDLGSGSGFCGSDKDEGENGKSVDMGSKNLDPGVGNHSPSDKKENEIILLSEEKNGDDKVESRNGCCENQTKGSISSSRLVPNSSSRRKVFKIPSSFSYRRMLPFLVDMAKDDSSASRIDIEELSCQIQNSISVDSNVSSDLTDSYNAKNEHIGEGCDYTESLDEGDIKNFQDQLHVERGNLDDSDKKLSQTEELGSSSDKGTNHENFSTGLDELIENCVLTTPPDATILSEIDIQEARTKGRINTLKNQDHVLGDPSNGSTCANHMSMPKKSHRCPTKRNNTISMTKLNLNPCSRSKVFRTSSSFSYRRLLPFLMDVAKSSGNIDQSPNIQKNLESNHRLVLLSSSDMDVSLSKNVVDKFEEEQETKDHEQNHPNTVEVHSLDVSSDDICPNLLTPSSSSNANSNSASPEINSQHDVPNCLQMERTSPNTRVKLNEPTQLEVVLPVADFRVCNDEANCSTETSCSTINNGSLPRETLLEVSQHEPVLGKKCITQGIICHNGKADTIKYGTLDQNSSKIGAYHFQGIDNSMKGILKRNPRGCRGLCNCLNCASFRLHAERAFEFSRNQMLDTEEVAMGLIHELAEIRSMLENSAVDGSNLSTIQLKKIQVKEACKKALKTEQLAKQLLLQMKDDLNEHCRIKPLQRPTVTFAGYIEEKSIPTTGLLTSPNQQQGEEKINDILS